MATQLRFDVSALDKNAAATFAKLATVIDRFERQLDKLDGKRVDAEIGVDTRKAEREVGAFATNMRRKLEAATKALPEIEIRADSSDAELELAAIRGDLAELRDATVGVDIDATLAQARIEEIGGRLRRLANESPDIQVRADAAEALAKLGLVEQAAEELDGKKVKVKVEADRSLGDTLIHITRLTDALGKLALPAAAIAAAPQIASIGAAAVTASGALGLLPAAGVAGAAAVGSLALAFRGFSDAVGDDPKKAAEAMSELAPEAREAAQAVRDVTPAWSAMQDQVQNAAFKGVAEDLRQLSKDYLPATERTLVGVAAGFNAAWAETSKFLRAPSVIRDVDTALGDVERGTRNATGALAPLTRAFVDLFAEGAKRVPELGQGLDDAAERFARFIDRARESGQLGEWIDEGIESVETLGSVVGNVGGILGSVFKASRDSGADFLSTLDELTGAAEEFLSTGEGQSALVGIFTEINDMIDAAGPGIAELAGDVAEFVQAADDADVLQSFGEFIGAAAEEAGELLGGLQPLLPVLSTVLSTAADLAPVLAPLVVGFVAMKAATAGLDKIGDIAGGIGRLAGAARDADGKVGGLTGKLDGLKGKVVGGIAFAALIEGLAAIQRETAGADGSVDGFTDTLQDLSGALGDIATLNFSGIFGDIAAEFNQMQRHLEGDNSFTFNVDTGPAKEQVTQFMNALKGQTGTINIDGRTTDATQALADIMQAIRQGRGEVIIDGKPVPAQEALDRVVAQINATGGLVEINGNMVPAGDALRMFLESANKTEATVPVKADATGIEATLQTVYQRIDEDTPTVYINGDTVGATEALNLAITAINNGEGEVTINGQTMNAVEAAQSVVSMINASQGDISIGGDPVPAGKALADTLAAIRGGEAEVSIGGNKVPVEQALAAILAQANSTAAMVTINGNTVPAAAVLQDLQAAINAGQGTVTINGQSVPAASVLSAFVGNVNVAQGTVTINGQSVPAGAALNALIAAVNAGQGTVTMNGQSAPANSVLSALLQVIGGSKRDVTIGAVDRASPVLAGIRDKTVTVTIIQRTQVVGTINGPQATGGIVSAMADGGVLPMASGGTWNGRRMTAAQAGVAKIYPPNTPRIIGDRIRDDEAYIPLVPTSVRSTRILEIAADRMGYDLFKRGPASTDAARAPMSGVAQAATAIAQPRVLSVGGGSTELRADINALVREIRLLRGDSAVGRDGPETVAALGQIVAELRRSLTAVGRTTAARAISEGGAF